MHLSPYVTHSGNLNSMQSVDNNNNNNNNNNNQLYFSWVTLDSIKY